MALRWRQGTAAIWLLMWCVVWVIGCPPTRAEDAASYRSHIEQCRPFLIAAAQAERMAIGTGMPWAMEALQRLGPSNTVQFQGRRHVPATDSLRAVLLSLYSGYLTKAAEGLDATVDSLDTRLVMLQPSPAPPPMVMAHAEEALSAELKRAAYQVGYLASLRQSIDEYLERLLQNLHPGDFNGDYVTFFLIMALLGAVGTALGLLVIRVIRVRRRRNVEPAEPVPAWEETPADTGTCLHFAEQAASEGRYEDALRWLFRAALQSLQENGHVEDRPECTNWEMVRMLDRGFPQTAEPFRQMVMLFDAHIYGGRLVTEERYREGLVLLQTIRGGETI